MKMDNNRPHMKTLKIQTINKLKNFPLENRYMIKKQIGKGEFGLVYLAENFVQSKHSTVVVKMTQNHATNNREVEFLERAKNSLSDKQKLHFPTILSNGLVEINDPLL